MLLAYLYRLRTCELHISARRYECRLILILIEDIIFYINSFTLYMMEGCCSVKQKSVEAGVSGLFMTCDNNERQAIAEAYNIIDHLMEEAEPGLMLFNLHQSFHSYSIFVNPSVIQIAFFISSSTTIQIKKCYIFF
uniref:FTCD_N domain-containing protein n=1 Tax=Angiostrongylus cantonensis TaxID=6313 RepID=A0A0K0CWT9_ANGCA